MAPAAGNHDTEGNQYTVFIDTSLDTHLVMTVSDSDTVSDFKNRIMLEHHQCFPAIGDIKIEYLKVKRRGTFYRLSDSMLVKNAFATTKKNWFVSVDASRLEQDGGIQHLDEHKARDQLTLPWVTGADTRLIDRHDNHADKPSFVNQKASKVDQLTCGDSCKDVSKKIEEERSSNDKPLNFEVQEKVHTGNKDIQSKKRTRDVHIESSLVNDSGSGPSVKKKRKTKGVKNNGKASEENMVLTYDSHKAKDNEASINDENYFEHNSKGKDLSDENTRINKGERFCDLEQVATAVPSGVEDMGKETCPRNTEASETVANEVMVVEKNIQQETSFGVSEETRALNTKASETVADVAMVVEKNIQQETHFGISGSGPSVKKKHKIKRVKSNGKAAEENVVLTHDSNKAKDNEASVNNEISFVQKSKGKDLSDENTRINKGEIFSNLDEVATAVPSVVDVGKETRLRNTEASETVADVAMVVEKNIQQETPFGISEKETRDGNTEASGTVADVVMVVENNIQQETQLGILESVASVKKKSKIKRVKHNVKASKENMVLANDDNKVKDNEASINHKDSFEQKLNGENLSDENTKINKGESCSNLDQVAIVVTSVVEDVGKETCPQNTEASETVADVAMVAEKNIQQDMPFGISEKENDSEPVEKAVTDNKIPPSLIRTSDCEHDAPGLTSLSHRKGSKRSIKHKAAEKEVSSTSFSKELHNINTDATDSSLQQDVGSIAQECTGDQSDKHKEDNEVLLKQGPQEKHYDRKTRVENLTERKRRTTRSAVKKKDESLVKHGADNHVGNISSSTVAAPGFGEKSLVDAKKGDDVIMKEVEVSKPTENQKDRVHVENVKGKSRKESKKRKDGERSASRNDEKQTNDAGSVTNEGKVLPQSETKQSLDILSKSGIGQVDAEKQNEDMDGAKKKKTKSKKKSSAERNENESIRKHAAKGDVSMPATGFGPPLDGHFHDNARKEGESSLLDVDGKDGDKMKGEDKGKNTETLTVSEVSKIRMEGKDDVYNEPKDGSHEIDFMDYFAPASQPNMIAAVDTTQSGKQKKSKSKTKDSPLVQASPNPSIQSQKLISKPKTNSSKVSIDVVKEPNMSQVKAPKGTTKIDAKKGDGASEESSSSSSSASLGKSFHNQKSSKQQSILGQTHAKTVKKSRAADVNSSQQVKSLFNTPGTIFGDDTSADDNESVDSDSSTRTPSRKSSSLSGESDSSIHSRRKGSHAIKRNEGGGKNSINTQSKLKNRSMAELLRSSSRFKKAKFSASQQMEDTESQPVDFVPDSQPVGKM